MFNPESVIGEVTDPQGRLTVSSVSDTECVCFNYRSNDGTREFTLVYNARELSSLVAAVKKGAEMAPQAKPRSTIRLSALVPKPIRLQVVLVAPENKSPLIILRFLGTNWKQDLFAQPETLVDLFQKAQRRAPMPGVVGILDRFGTAIWMIEGQTLEVNDEYSHGTGFYGEYVHHSEVPESQVVRAWPSTIDGKMVVVAFEFAQAWEPSVSPDLPQGQQGDQALAEGQVRQSREVHALLSKTMYDTGKVDPVWAGKIALASILGDIKMSDDKAGLATWTGNGGNPVLKLGVDTIRAGKLSPHDTAIFAMISAYFHSKEADKGAAVPLINEHMSSAFTYARFNAPEMKHLVLNNWYLLLKRCGQSEGSPAFSAWEQAKTHYPEALVPTAFCLPPSFPWVKTWKPARTSEEPVKEAAPVAAPTVPSGPLKKELPPVTDRPRIPEIDGPMARPEEDAEEERLENEGPFKGLDDPKKEKKKSPLPLILAGLVLVGAPVVYFLSNRAPAGPEPTPTPTPTVAASTAVTPTPRVVATPTPEPITNEPLPAGNLLVGGFNLDNRIKEADILKAGYQQTEIYEGDDAAIARFSGPDGEIIANLALPSRQVTAIQAGQLTLDGKKVATLETPPEALKNDSRFSKYKLQAVVDNEGKIRAYTFAQDSIYLPEPLIGSPIGALQLSRKIKDKNFFENLPEEVVNMYLTDGSPLMFQYLGSFELDRLKYLLDQGADPNQKNWTEGSTSLHVCDNVKTAQLLLKRGADPAITNDEGKKPVEVAKNEQVRAVLAAALPATPTPTPGAAATPSVSGTPGTAATPSQSASPSPKAPSPTSTPDS